MRQRKYQPELFGTIHMLRLNESMEPNSRHAFALVAEKDLEHLGLASASVSPPVALVGCYLRITQP